MKRNFVANAIADPTKNLLAFIFIVTFGFGIVTNGLSNLVLETLGDWLQSQWHISKLAFQLLLLGSLISLILGMIYLTDIARGLRRLFRVRVVNDANVVALEQTFPGLITVMSLSKRTTPAEMSILHHWQEGQGSLRHCWLVCSPDALDAAKAMSSRLKQLCQQQGNAYHAYNHENYKPSLQASVTPSLTVLIVRVDETTANDPNAIRQIVDGIYTDAAKQFGLDATQLIADYTGGTKSMTAGIVLAGTEPARHLQYIRSEYDTTGAMISSQVMEVKLSYKLKPMKADG